jgi:subtilisin family serine protease
LNRTTRSLLTASVLTVAAVAPGCAAEPSDGGVSPPVDPGGPTWLANVPAAAGEAIVGYAPGASDADRGRARGRVGARAKKAVSGDVEVWTLPAGASVEGAARSLAGDASVAYVEPNYVVHHQTLDAGYGQLWGLHNTGQLIDNTTRPDLSASGTADVDIDAPEAWGWIASTPNGARAGAGDPVYVGVIDEGIDFDHPDLAGRVVNPGEVCGDGIDNDGNGFVDDCHGWDFFGDRADIYAGPGVNPDGSVVDAHGTHVGGTIAALGDNEIGVVGVARNVRLISGKFLGPDGGYTSDAVAAVKYFTDLKVKRGVTRLAAVNNSWGGGAFSKALYDAIAEAGQAGILFVIAAGNDGRDNDKTASYPCNYSKSTRVQGRTLPGLTNILCVAAHDQKGAIASFSNWGATTVHVAAPGVNILSTTPENTYAYYRGTSMAAPHVTGLAALLAAEGLGMAQVASRIRGTVVPNTGSSWNRKATVTKGRINAYRALANTAAVDP